MVREIGLVVIAAAWVEDLAGELVQLRSNLDDGSSRPAKGWAAGGEQLAEALEKVAGGDLADRLRKAQKARHQVVHGVFLGIDGSQECEAVWASMKRKISKADPPSYEVASWKPGGLRALIEEFAAIEGLLDDEISYAMGLKVRPDPAG